MQVWAAAALHLVLDSGMLISEHSASAQERREAGVAVMCMKLLAHTRELRAAAAEPRRVWRLAGGTGGSQAQAGEEGN